METYSVQDSIEKVKEILGDQFESYEEWQGLYPVTIRTPKVLDNWRKLQVMRLFPQPVRIYFNSEPDVTITKKKVKGDYARVNPWVEKKEVK